MKWPPQRRALQGELVRLEPISPGHRDELLEISHEPEAWTWINRLVPQGDDHFDDWFEARLAASRDAREWCFATRSIERDEAIGSSSFLNIRPEHDGLEIGWTWLHPSAWRSGANIEAKLLMLTEAFENLGCMRVEFKTDARNERSRTALAALPATFEGVFRKHMLMPGIGVRDSAYFSVTDDDWPEVRANLERRLARNVTHA